MFNIIKVFISYFYARLFKIVIKHQDIAKVEQQSLFVLLISLGFFTDIKLLGIFIMLISLILLNKIKLKLLVTLKDA